MRPDEDVTRRIEIESTKPPRPDDTGRHELQQDERFKRILEAARRADEAIRESSSPHAAAPLPPPALPVPDVVFGEVIDATPAAREVVLIVDDDVEWQGIWRRALVRDGVELHIAGRLHEALSLVDNFRTLAVAVLDWRLPNGDGVHAAEAIVLKFPEAKIMVCSGYDSVERPNEEMRERFRRAAPRCTFHPKQVAAGEVRRGLRTPHGGMPPVK